MKTPASIRKLFFILGWAAIFAGLFSFAYGWLELRPRLAGVTEQINQDLSDLTSVTQSLKQNQSASARLFALLPNAVTTLHGTLLTTSETMYGTAKTTNDVKKGVTGLLMPKTALGIDTNRLSKTGNQLRLLADVVGQMEEPVTELSGEFTGATSQIDNVTSRIDSLHGALHDAHLPFQAGLLCSAFSIVYFLFGGFCFVFAYAFEALVSTKSSEKSDRAHATNAA